MLIWVDILIGMFLWYLTNKYITKNNKKKILEVLIVVFIVLIIISSLV